MSLMPHMHPRMQTRGRHPCTPYGPATSGKDIELLGAPKSLYLTNPSKGFPHTLRPFFMFLKAKIAIAMALKSLLVDVMEMKRKCTWMMINEKIVIFKEI